MNNIKMKKFFCCIIILSMIMSMVCTYCNCTIIDVNAMTIENNRFSKKVGDNKEKQHRIIVELEDKSVADKNKVSNYSTALKKKENSILCNQKDIIKEAEKITGNKIKKQSSYLMNMFSINATEIQMNQIKKIDGVKGVRKANVYKALMSNALKSGNAYNQVQSKKYGYTGKGTVVAVIDTGVNYKHKDMVLDKGTVPKYSEAKWKEKIKLLGYGKYCSSKVPFGYDYTTGTNDCLNKNEDHGYHVSGIASANGEIKGVAPNAQIIGLKVLDDSGVGTDDDIICAIEDAVKLGVDVINMSLGPSYRMLSSDDYIKAAIDKAAKSGVVSCIAAGNSGTSSGLEDNTNLLGLKDTGLLNSAATSKNSVAVAASVNSDYKTSGKMNAKVGSEVVSFSYVDIMGYGFNIKDTYMRDGSSLLNKQGKLTGSSYLVKDNIIVVNYNKTTVNNSLYDLSKAEAKGIILIDENDKINNNIRPYDWYGVPVIIVNKSTGEKLIKEANNYKRFSYENTIQGKESNTDISMAYFSSWGPCSDLTIKPEITAPGANVKSTVGGTDNYAVYSGTSMATPFIAGAEAVMLNAVKARKLSISKASLNSFLKNSLMNTADVIYEPGTNIPYSVRYQGAGQVDVYGAVNNNVLLTYKGAAKVELGELSTSKTFNMTLSNYGAKAVSYNLKETPIYTDYTKNNEKEEYEYGLTPFKGVRLIFNKTKVTVPAKGKVTITAKLSIPSGTKQYGFVEGYIKLNGVNCESIGMPLLGYYGKWASDAIVDKSLYESKSSVLNNKNNITGIQSMTSLISLDSGTTSSKSGIQGEYYVKKKMDTTPSREENVNQNKNTLSREKVNKAVRVSLDKEYELPIVNKGDSAVYKIVSTENVGFNIKVSDELGIPIYKLYSEQLELIDTNDTSIINDIGFRSSFSIKRNKTYYIELSSRYESQGLYNVRFETTSYEEDEAIGDSPYVYEDIVNLAIGKTKDIYTNKDNIRYISFTPKQTGYYNINIKSDAMIEYELYKNNSYYFSVFGDNIVQGEDFKNIKKTVWLEKDNKYILELNKPYASYILNNATKPEASIYATITVSETKDTNAYILESKYSGKYVAFSKASGAEKTNVAPLMSQVRDAKEMAVYILNKDKRVVRKIAHNYNVGKKILSQLESNEGENLLFTGENSQAVLWDGKLYSKPKGQYVNAPSGQYYIQIVSTITNKKQSIVMPVKIDNTKPKISSFKIEKNGRDTIVKFKVTDNTYLAPYYKVNTKQPYQKQEEANYNVRTDETISYEKYFVETTKNKSGEYEINFGNIEDTLLNFTFYDIAGNSVTSKNVEGELYKNYKPIEKPIDDYDEREELYQLYDGVYMNRKFEEDTVIHTEEDNTYEIVGECAKNLDVIVNGEVAIKEMTGEEEHKGYMSYFVYAPINTSKNTAGIKISIRNRTTNKIVYTKTFSVRIDKQAPNLEIVNSSDINKTYYDEYDREFYVLLNKAYKEQFSFDVKVVDDYFLEEGFRISNGSYKYLGNQTYRITIKDVLDTKAFTAEVYDKSDYASQFSIFVLPPKNEEEYNQMVDGTELAFEILNLDDEIITSDMLNSDGMLTLEGTVNRLPDSLIINNKKVKVDSKTLTFTTKIKINKGSTKLNIVLSKNGRKNTSTQTLYYDKMSISLKGIPKANKKRQIIVKNKTFKFSGTISSYTALTAIKVNGNNILNKGDVAVGRNKPLTRNFTYTSFLNRGKNIITIIGYNMIGQTVSKRVVVYYVPKK